MPLHRDRSPSPERLFARVWEEDDVEYPIPQSPEPSTPPAAVFSGLLIEIDDQPPLPPAAGIPTSVSAPTLAATASSANASPSAAPASFTARGPALNPTRAPFTSSKASTSGAPRVAQNGSTQTSRRGVSNGAPNNIDSSSGPQRQNGPTKTSPQRPSVSASRHRPDSEPRLAPGKLHFPKGLGLETTREAKTANIKKKEQEREKALLSAPKEDEVVAAEGIYLWPDKAHLPTELLGLQLEDLNHIRFHYGVWIVWDEELKSLVVMAARGSHAQQSVRDALAAVRQDYENARARSNLAAPLYVAVPPSVHAIRTIVKPEKYGMGMTMIELQGEHYPRDKAAIWTEERTSMIKDGQSEIKAHLLKNLRALAPVKGWMRMRVNFGHLNISNYPKEFSQGKCDFKGFLEVLKHPRAQASATFERKLPNPLSALNLKSGIEAMPEFCSIFGVAWSKDTVIFRESLCLFFETAQGIPLRLEMDMDYNEIGGYQPGVIKCFRNNRRNKHLEILSCDPEKQIDWALELITDNMIKDPEPEWESYISKCIATGESRYDSLGLPYPAICLRHDTKIRIKTAVVRSKISYMLAKSGYHVDLTIYREWYCTTGQPNATLEPVIKAGVSMYHPQWDSQMMSIEETIIQREWDDDLNQLFNPLVPMERPGHVIDHFLGEVNYVAELLSTVFYDDFNNLKSSRSS